MKNKVKTTRIKKGKLALFCDGVVISGDCTFTAIKINRLSGEAVFQITMVKVLTK